MIVERTQALPEMVRSKTLPLLALHQTLRKLWMVDFDRLGFGCYNFYIAL